MSETWQLDVLSVAQGQPLCELMAKVCQRLQGHMFMVKPALCWCFVLVFPKHMKNENDSNKQTTFVQ